jgi:two-component system, OmpR family, response regulator RegX3
MHIALLEDETTLAQEIRTLLTGAGHTVEHYVDGHLMMRALLKDTIDLFVLDWHVPGPSGMEVMQHVRQTLKLSTPIIFLTSNSAEEQIVQALDAGADDYCAKPVRTQEFMARVAALLRRVAPPAAMNLGGELLPGYVFDHVERVVRVHGEPVVLTEKEYELSRLLFENPDRPIARQRIMKDIWGREEDALSRTLDVHISWIRRKLNIGANADQVRLVVVHGFGYRLMNMTNPAADNP